MKAALTALAVLAAAVVWASRRSPRPAPPAPEPGTWVPAPRPPTTGEA